MTRDHEWLKIWSDETLGEFNLLRARHYSVRKALATMVEGGANEYSYVNVAAYARSPQGKKDLQAAYEVVRSEAKTLSYSHSGSRIETLVEIADKMLHTFRGVSKVTEMTKLAGEIRDVLKEIRAEVDPYGIESQTVKSHFETILTGMQGLPPRHRNMILGATKSKPSTSETATN